MIPITRGNKNSYSLSDFKNKIIKLIPEKCPCKL